MSEKMKWLKENKSGTWTIKVQRKDYKFHETYKTRDEALEKIDKINKELNELKSKKNKVNDDKILVSPEYEYILTKYKWSISKETGYVSSTIDGVTDSMHRFIYKLRGIELMPIQHIDQISGNKLDNRNENLRIVTAGENAQNKQKKKNTTSIYYGVSKNKKENKFIVQLVNSTLNLHLKAYYKNEKHAAWQYNLWIDTYKLIHTNKNDVDEPTYFILYIKPEKKDDLPDGISKNRNRFISSYKNIRNRSKTLKEAIIKLQYIKDEYEKKRINKIKSQPILRNSDGFAIIQKVYKGNSVDVIVDNDKYYDLLIQGSITISNGYAQIKINNKQPKLHRYLMNIGEYNGENKIDHINGNTLDNRLCNLRLATSIQNAQNKSSSINSTSHFIGVSWNKAYSKWQAQMTINKKNKYLGSFDNEEEAARARDAAVIKHIGGHGKLNFPLSQ